MAGSRIQVELVKSGLDRVAQRLQQIAHHTGEPEALTDALGQLLETQTKRRISDEKTDPDGKAWDDWSVEYAQTRKPQHSILINAQNLLDSIAGGHTKTQASIGSEMIYAAVHQNGWTEKNIKPRPYLGLSNDNVREIDAEVERWFNAVFAA